MDLLKYISKKVFIVAEIGNNHNGSAEMAKRLIDAASNAGADAVKFQTFRGCDIVVPNVLSNEYPEWEVKEFKYWCEFLDSIALPLDKHKEIFNYAKEKGLIPFSTPTSPWVVDFLEKLDVGVYKVASMDVTNVQLLEKIALTGKPVIMSTGMASEEEIRRAIGYFDDGKRVLLHCTSNYPTKDSDACINTISWLKDKFGGYVGFSDHTLNMGSIAREAVVSKGARVIEKHITLDRATGLKAEHHFALEPEEFKSFVGKIRSAGLTELEDSLSEIYGEYGLGRKESKDNISKFRRSLHINKDLRAGHILDGGDISVLRPGDGAEPGRFNDFLGKKLMKDKKVWAPLGEDDI